MIFTFQSYYSGLYEIAFIKQYSPFFSLGTGLVALLSRKKRETPLEFRLKCNLK